MPQINLSLLPSVSPVIIEKTFTDDRCPGVEFPMRFGIMPYRSDSDKYFFGDTYARLEQRFVKDNIPVRVQGGLTILIESNLCAGVAACIMAERLTGTEATWSPEEWFQFSVVAPSAWREIQKWLITEEKRVRGEDANSDDEDGDGDGGEITPSPNA